MLTTKPVSDVHSDEVAVGTVDISEWVVVHPGQKVGIPPLSNNDENKFKSARGNVMRISNKPKARTLKKLRLSKGDVLFAKSSSSSLCLKYTQMSRAIFTSKSIPELNCLGTTYESKMPKTQLRK